MSNPEKDKIQDRAIISSRKRNHLVLEWSTGTGKTLAAIKIISDFLFYNPLAVGTIVCKETTHRKNWLDDISKHGYNHILDNTSIILYASAKKIVDVDFLILDECHALTPQKTTLIKSMLTPTTKVIYLSATIKKEKEYLIERMSDDTAGYYRIPLTEAIAMKLLPSPSVVIHKSKLKNGNDRSYNYIMSKGVKSRAEKVNCAYYNRWDVFNKYKNIQLNVACNEVEYYQLISEQMEYYKNLSYSGPEGMKIACRNKFLNLGSQRKKFLSTAKTSKAKQLVQKFRHGKHKFICFTGSIEQTELLTKTSAVHSKNTREENQDLVNCFNSNECSELFAVKMLREGVNLTNVHKGIIVQLDSTIGSFYQMLGRCLRHEFPEMHLIIMEETQDEVYFTKAMKDFDKKYVTNE
mgnify:FL=1|tara:strand:- start:1212 stop:2435 length:1224 start_codon:yes stop_codon:yes gene_type:complete